MIIMTAPRIIAAVAEQHGMTVEHMLSAGRNRALVRARWDAMHMLRVTVKPNGGVRSLHEIARALGGLDHTTVLFGLRRRAALSDAKREVEAA